MTPLAAIVLAHSDPVHVRRLIDALEDVPVVLHCDAATPTETYRRMTDRLPPRVTLANRRRTTLASWSLVAAELDGLRVALATTKAEHIAVLSGADYPLLPIEELVKELSSWQGRSWITNLQLPMPSWNTPRHLDGGLWRFKYRYLTYRDQLISVRGIALHSLGRRRIPSELSLRASPHWKIYARHHAEILLKLVDDRPDLINFWKHTIVPEESFVASMLSSPTLAGPDVLPLCLTSAWYIDWRGATDGHPRWLTATDFDDLKAGREAERPPSTFPSEVANKPHDQYRKLFARKFRSTDSAVVDRIDVELRDQYSIPAKYH